MGHLTRMQTLLQVAKLLSVHRRMNSMQHLSILSPFSAVYASLQSSWNAPVLEFVAKLPAVANASGNFPKRQSWNS